MPAIFDSESHLNKFHSQGDFEMHRYALGAAFVCFLVTPVLAGDPAPNWADIGKDLKDLKADYKDLKTDYSDLKSDKQQFKNAIANGNLTAAAKYAADIAADKHDILADKRDIHANIKDLKNDGVALPKGRR
jgi:spermidine/putrescine-binding protein